MSASSHAPELKLYRPNKNNDPVYIVVPTKASIELSPNDFLNADKPYWQLAISALPSNDNLNLAYQALETLNQTFQPPLSIQLLAPAYVPKNSVAETEQNSKAMKSSSEENHSLLEIKFSLNEIFTPQAGQEILIAIKPEENWSADVLKNTLLELWRTLLKAGVAFNYRRPLKGKEIPSDSDILSPFSYQLRPVDSDDHPIANPFVKIYFSHDDLRNTGISHFKRTLHPSIEHSSRLIQAASAWFEEKLIQLQEENPNIATRSDRERAESDKSNPKIDYQALHTLASKQLFSSSQLIKNYLAAFTYHEDAAYFCVRLQAELQLQETLRTQTRSLRVSARVSALNTSEILDLYPSFVKIWNNETFSTDFQRTRALLVHYAGEPETSSQSPAAESSSWTAAISSFAADLSSFLSASVNALTKNHIGPVHAILKKMDKGDIHTVLGVLQALSGIDKSPAGELDQITQLITAKTSETLGKMQASQRSILPAASSSSSAPRSIPSQKKRPEDLSSSFPRTAFPSSQQSAQSGASSSLFRLPPSAGASSSVSSSQETASKDPSPFKGSFS